MMPANDVETPKSTHQFLKNEAFSKTSAKEKFLNDPKVVNPFEKLQKSSSCKSLVEITTLQHFFVGNQSDCSILQQWHQKNTKTQKFIKSIHKLTTCQKRSVFDC